uniref:Uncharacterized protein n=1 Tax=Brassica oleracea TaxID=3712 RepID=A0A3P6G1Z6_BRAOL|nr:unnamed protein product [Brassica oleracea]
MAVSVQPSPVVEEVVAPAAKPKEGPSRCTTCNKRVDIHNCSFNYHEHHEYNMLLNKKL